MQIVCATLDNYEWIRQSQDADVRTEAHHNWVDEVVRCEGRGGSVVGNDIRSSCLIIQPRPEIKDPSLLTRYMLSKSYVLRRRHLLAVAALAVGFLHSS